MSARRWWVVGPLVVAVAALLVGLGVAATLDGRQVQVGSPSYRSGYAYGQAGPKRGVDAYPVTSTDPDDRQVDCMAALALVPVVGGDPAAGQAPQETDRTSFLAGCRAGQRAAAGSGESDGTV